jgi:hypothetical protein
MDRRNFVVRAFLGLGAVMATTVLNTGCFLSGTIFTKIMGYVGLGLAAFQAVVSLLDPPLALAMAGGIALVKAGFADVQTAVQDYNNAPAADKATLLGKVKIVLADLQTEIQSFWSNLHLPGATGGLISSLLGIILSTLAGFAGQLGSLPAGAKLKMLPANPLPVTPKPRSKKQFEADFNKALTDAGQQPVNFGKD